MFASGKTAAVASAANYIEECFSTYLYTGNGSTQTITNGIDLSTKGGLVWTKDRNSGANHQLFDTARGLYKRLATNSTAAEYNYSPDGLTAFNSSGFTMTGNGDYNSNGYTIASWTFRKQPKFYTQGTYTGNGVQGRGISHDLGSTPGCIIVKKTSGTGNWVVYHSGAGTSGSVPKYLLLNTTDGAQYYDNTTWSAVPTSTQFFVGTDADVNANGSSYVYYVFASNAGGFGLTGTDNVISCGSYTGNGSTTGPVIDLGYEPQWLLVKQSSASGNDWILVDNMRGFPVTGNTAYLNPNNSFSESSFALVSPTATGFQPRTTDAGYNGNGSTYIYIAIRRGPMKVPTSGTSVYNGIARTGTGASATITGVGFPTDLVLSLTRNFSGTDHLMVDRLRGSSAQLFTNLTAAESTNATSVTSLASNDGISVGTDYPIQSINYASGYTYVTNFFRRAPSFFDVICYTGTGNNLTVNHNLGVAPEIVIIKRRSSAASNNNWYCGWNMNASTYMEAILNTSDAGTLYSYPNWFTSAPTSTTFAIAGGGNVNANTATYVAYLFATCAGVSKCTAFTGTGTLQTINCGFTAGSRFVLIKRTDAAGDWYVWDSSRGLSSSTDPYLLLNSTAAEVTSTNWVDTTSTGFQVTAASGNNVNINGASYIALAIA